MYLEHFGLNEPPFRITPDTRYFFVGAQRGAVLAALAYAIHSGEGIVKLVGEVGSGKTMLCRMLADRLPETVEIVYLANPSLSPDDILHAIALELGLALSPAATRLEVLDALQRHLLSRYAEGRRVVVFVEEAQGMPLETLEEIRLLSNLETREAKLLQIVLFGQPELDQRLAVHELRQLRDRITHSFRLEPLKGADTAEYLRFRLQAAGWQGGDLFTPRAARLLARLSGGLLRRIHVLADKALLAAFAEGASQVKLRHVHRAWQDAEPPPRRLLPALPKTVWRAAAGLALIGLGYGLHQALPGRAPAAIAPLAVAAEPAPPANTAAPAPKDPIATAVESPAASGPAPLLSSRLQATRAWLRSVGDARYTIQLLLSEDAGTGPLERFLRRPGIRAHLDDIYVYATEVKGTPRWSVVMGGYADHAAAKEAMAALPEGLRTYHPYLRSVEAVRREATGSGMLAQGDLS